MADKRRQTNEAISNLLRQEATQPGINVNPASIPSDFESWFIATIPIVSSNSRHRGCCHFHLTQAIFQQVQAFGLALAYSAHNDIQRLVRQQMALAFPSVAIACLTFATFQGQLKAIFAPLFANFRQQWLTSVSTLI